MIVGPLKNNAQLSVITLLIVCVGLWINSFLFANHSVPDINHQEDILYHLFFDGSVSSRGQQIISLFAIMLGALLLNFITISQEITSKINFLPSFIYILFAFTFSNNYAAEPVLIANLFALPALYYLIKSYREEQALSEFFTSGVLMGLASFFYIHYIYLFPICFVALVILRAFNWREWCVLSIGLLTPLYGYLSLSYLSNNSVADELHLMKLSLTVVKTPIISEYYLVFLLVLIILLVLALFNYISKGFGTKIKSQKTKFILLWMCLFCLLMVFFEHPSDDLLLPCIIPLSIIIGDYLAEIKQLKIANTLLVLFMGGFAIVYLHILGVI